MSDLIIRTTDKAGHITLNRPEALNALTYDMVLEIEKTLDAWRHSDLQRVIIDGAGDRAFCAGGDIADMYASGQRGDLTYGRKFWQDEYRLNAKIATYPKPIVTFLHGFTMGGGVGIGCHASDRIVCESSQIAMPECSIGLVPDVGGSYLLARAEGFAGTYFGITGARMHSTDAVGAGFADFYIPSDEWDTVKHCLLTEDNMTIIDATDQGRGSNGASVNNIEINQHFRHGKLKDILESLAQGDTDFCKSARKAIERNAPLAMACAVQIIDRVRQNPTIENALKHEYRYTHRAVAQGDFIEGIRAAIIDKDRNPRWQHRSPYDVTSAEVDAMISPLQDQELNI